MYNMIKFKGNNNSNNLTVDTLKELMDTIPDMKNPIYKTKNFTIRDIRVGSIVHIHLMNRDRGDKGFVDCEVVAVFNSAGQRLYDVKGDFSIIYEGKDWLAYCSQINRIISY